MNRFLIFAWDYIYPEGGMNNLQDSFEGLEEAKEFADSLRHDWYEVYDTERDFIVYETKVIF